ncbi:MAG: DGQHR domain-containing protein [Saprospiraceae bacterium]|nr:DGQHR domain-containing protein [Saprospiraceae bacterium]MBP6565876.1 DGQHR domain-containing protein [Saprospiraceae bacterium]
MIQGNLISASRVKQNNQEFLVGIFTIQQILTFTKYTERLIDYFNEDNLPVYNPRVQRKLELGRVEKIADFLMDDPDALFPTNLVLAVPNAAIESIEDQADGKVQILLNQKVFRELEKEKGDVYLTIIDGQHRVKGIEKAIERLKLEIKSLSDVYRLSKNVEFEKKIIKKNGQLIKLLNINLLVSFFIDPSLEFQAMVFSTINRTQKTVPQSLVSSLFGLTEKDTPQKTALEIVLALNAFEGSPFYNRVKLHGGKYQNNQSPPLTQAAMVKSIFDLISTNQRELERDRFRDRSELLINCNSSLPFRKYYASNNDKFITDILYSFFTGVKDVFVKNGVSFWNFNENTKPKNILHTTVGYQALLQILVDILANESEDAKRDKIETYKNYLNKCKNLNFDDQQRYPFTSIAKTIFYLDMHLQIWKPLNENDDRIKWRDEALKKRT